MNQTAAQLLQKLVIYLKATGRFVGRTAKRYPYIVVALIVIAASAATVYTYQKHQTALWHNATDDYRRANYQKATAILIKMPLPKDPEKLRIYSQSMLATSHLDQALKGYQALYTKTNDPQAKLVIGNIYNEQRKYDQAVNVYNELISSNPNFIQAYVNLATVRRLQGSPSEAIATAKRGIADNPSNAILYELLVSLTMDNKQSADYQAALANLKRLNPNDPLLTMLKEAPTK